MLFTTHKFRLGKTIKRIILRLLASRFIKTAGITWIIHNCIWNTPFSILDYKYEEFA
jgi:hypothetical protein